jgi:superfamily II DNA or RNA helicase
LTIAKHQDRPYQNECLDAILAAAERGIRKMLVSKATGLGKTETFAMLPKHMGKQKMIVVIHTRKLVKQTADKLAARNPDLNVGIEMGNFYAPVSSDIIVASVKTFSKTPARLQQFDASNFKWLVVDECHHSTADSYGVVIDHFMANEKCVLVGFTATPNRADGTAMIKVFDKIVYTYGMYDGIKDGWLAQVYGFTINTGEDLSKVTNGSDKDFNLKKLSEAVNTSLRNEMIVKAWIERMWPRQTIAFTVDIQHAVDLAAAFKRQGIRAEAVWGTDPDQALKIDKFANKGIDVLCCAQLLIEGYDYHGVEGIILAAPSKSQSKVIQCVGRGTRLDPALGGNMNVAIAEGRLTEDHKRDVLVMDCVGTFGKHSLATLPSLFGMSPKMDLQGQSLTDAVDTMRAAAKKFPNVDLSRVESLDDLTNLKMQDVDLWETKFADETQGMSELQWIKRSDGGFMLRLPRGEYFKVTEDAIGHFFVEGKLQGNEFDLKGLPSLAAAVGVVESEIVKNNPDILVLLGRESKWRKLGLKDTQIKILERLRVPSHIWANWNRGKASDFISKRFNRN